MPQVDAASKGYSQNLWLIGKEHFLTEVGTMVSLSLALSLTFLPSFFPSSVAHNPRPSSILLLLEHVRRLRQTRRRSRDRYSSSHRFVAFPPLPSSPLLLLPLATNTSSLISDIILPGVTRDSILSLLHDHANGTSLLPNLPKNITVVERQIPMAEVLAAEKNGTLREMFGSGTAALVSPVDR